MKKTIAAILLATGAVLTLTAGGCSVNCGKGQHIEEQTQSQVDANGDVTTTQVPVCVNN